MRSRAGDAQREKERTLPRKDLPTIRPRDLTPKPQWPSHKRPMTRDTLLARHVDIHHRVILKYSPMEMIDFPIDCGEKTCSEGFLILENTSERESVAFKVKTTRPDRYHVKPTVGMIGPKKKIRIRFVIRSEEVARIVASRFPSQNDVDPARTSSPTRRKCDKFMLMNIVVNHSERSFVREKLESIWSLPQWRKKTLKRKFRANIFKRAVISDDSSSEEENDDRRAVISSAPRPIDAPTSSMTSLATNRSVQKHDATLSSKLTQTRETGSGLECSATCVEFAWTKAAMTFDMPTDNEDVALLPPPPVGEVTLRNTMLTSWVTFKVKTTAPGRYAAQPTFGLVAPRRRQRLRFLMRAEDAADISKRRVHVASDVVCRDRFLVLSRVVTAAEIDPEIVLENHRNSQTMQKALHRLWTSSTWRALEKKSIKLSAAFTFPPSFANDSRILGNTTVTDDQILGRVELPVKFLTTTKAPFRWTRVRPVGQGRFGNVYLVKTRDLKSGSVNPRSERLAMKEIALTQHNGVITESTARKRFRDLSAIAREIDILKMLDHAHVVKYRGEAFAAAWADAKDSNEPTGNELCGSCCARIFMDFMDAGSVFALLRKFGPLPREAVGSYISQLCLAVAYLHTRLSVAHRDIKCGNVLLSQAGVVKLADFGAAVLIGSSQGDDACIGTAHWMSPEVIRNGSGRDEPMKSCQGAANASVDWFKADVWSLGCTMLEMATAKRPWNAFSNPLSAMYHIASTTKPPPLPPMLGDDSENVTKDSSSTVAADNKVHSEGATALASDALAFLHACFEISPKDRPSMSNAMEHSYVKRGLARGPYPIDSLCVRSKTPTGSIQHIDRSERNSDTKKEELQIKDKVSCTTTDRTVAQRVLKPDALLAHIADLARQLQGLRAAMRNVESVATAHGWVSASSLHSLANDNIPSSELANLRKVRRRAKRTLLAIDRDRFLCRARERKKRVRRPSKRASKKSTASGICPPDAVASKISNDTKRGHATSKDPTALNGYGVGGGSDGDVSASDEEKEAQRDQASSGDPGPKIADKTAPPHCVPSSEDADVSARSGPLPPLPSPLPSSVDASKETFMRKWLSISRNSLVQSRRSVSDICASVPGWIPILRRRMKHIEDIYSELRRTERVYDRAVGVYEKLEKTLQDRLKRVEDNMSQISCARSSGDASGNTALRGTIARKFLHTDTRRHASHRRSLQRRIRRVRKACEAFQRRVSRHTSVPIERAATKASELVEHVDRQVKILLDAMSSASPPAGPPPTRATNAVGLSSPPVTRGRAGRLAEKFNFCDSDIVSFRHRDDAATLSSATKQIEDSHEGDATPEPILCTPRAVITPRRILTEDAIDENNGDVKQASANTQSRSSRLHLKMIDVAREPLNAPKVPLTPPPMTPGGRPLFAVALAEYAAANDSELSLSRGDVIRVIRQHSNGWWKGEIGGSSIGWFPSNYTKLQYDLWPIQEDEENCSNSESEDAQALEVTML
eukprot:g2263.t1